MQQKKVTNILIDIGKARDLIEAENLNKLYASMQLFIRIEDEVNKKVQKYFNSNQTYELDFNRYDLMELSIETNVLLSKIYPMITYEGMKKDILQEKQITHEIFVAYTERWAKLMRLDAILRSMAKKLAYASLDLKMFDKKEANKPFDVD